MWLCAKRAVRFSGAGSFCVGRGSISATFEIRRSLQRGTRMRISIIIGFCMLSSLRQTMHAADDLSSVLLFELRFWGGARRRRRRPSARIDCRNDRRDYCPQGRKAPSIARRRIPLVFTKRFRQRTHRLPVRAHPPSFKLVTSGTHSGPANYLRPVVRSGAKAARCCTAPFPQNEIKIVSVAPGAKLFTSSP